MPEYQPGQTFTCECKILHRNGDGSVNVQFGPHVQVRLFPDQLTGLTPESFGGQEKPRMPLEDPRRAARKAQAQPEQPRPAEAQPAHGRGER